MTCGSRRAARPPVSMPTARPASPPQALSAPPAHGRRPEGGPASSRTRHKEGGIGHDAGRAAREPPPARPLHGPCSPAPCTCSTRPGQPLPVVQPRSRPQPTPLPQGAPRAQPHPARSLPCCGAPAGTAAGTMGGYCFYVRRGHRHPWASTAERVTRTTLTTTPISSTPTTTRTKARGPATTGTRTRTQPRGARAPRAIFCAGAGPSAAHARVWRSVAVPPRGEGGWQRV